MHRAVPVGVPLATAMVGVLAIASPAVPSAAVVSPSAGAPASRAASAAADAGSATQFVPLRLRYATFDPLAPRPQAADVPAPLRSVPGARMYIVQLAGPPTAEALGGLARLGVRIHLYLPDQAYLVAMDAALRARVAGLSRVRAVEPYHPAYKLDPPLARSLASPGPDLPRRRYSIMTVSRSTLMRRALERRIRSLGGVVHAESFSDRRLEATLTSDQLAAVARLDEVLFADAWAPADTDMDKARELSGADHLERVAGYTGRGVRGEVMDGGLRVSHRDFRARPPILHTANTASTGHGTATYGQIFGSGEGSPDARGLLPHGRGIFAAMSRSGNRATHTWSLVDPAGPYRAVFQSNSWGSGLTTDYTTVSADMDDILFDNDILILQSQSNAGSRRSRPQAWAKNILSVGGIRHRDTVEVADDAWQGGASIGPAADGRLKPDLAHFYDNIRTTSSASDTSYTNTFGGTSGATPITAGYSGLLFQMWADGVFAGGPGQNRDVFASRPHMTTAKALLVNSASQYAFSGTTHDLTRTHQGWGRVDVRNLYETAKASTWRLPVLIDETAPIGQGGRHRYQVTAAGTPSLRATLVYADPMGSPSAAVATVNDLTLKVTAPDGTVYWGNHGLAAGNWSTPGGTPNHVDTVENVFVRNATAGAWSIEVLAEAVNQDGRVETPALDADYALVVTLPSTANLLRGPTP